MPLSRKQAQIIANTLPEEAIKFVLPQNIKLKARSSEFHGTIMPMVTVILPKGTRILENVDNQPCRELTKEKVFFPDQGAQTYIRVDYETWNAVFAPTTGVKLYQAQREDLYEDQFKARGLFVSLAELKLRQDEILGDLHASCSSDSLSSAGASSSSSPVR